MCIDPGPQRGMTLIELIVFIVVVSVGLAGVLAVFNVVVRSSADPMIAKQALAVAEATLEEVLLKDFCDPTFAVSPPAGGTLAVGSPVVTQIDTTGIVVGWSVSGNGVPPQTTVMAMAANTVTLNNAATAAGTQMPLRFVSCAVDREATGRANYDDVMDYNTYATADAHSLDDLVNPIAGLSGYSVGITVAAPAGAIGDVAAADIHQVTVTVTVNGDAYDLTGYRFNYD